MFDIIMAIIGIASAASLIFMSDFPKLIALVAVNVLFSDEEKKEFADSLK